MGCGEEIRVNEPIQKQLATLNQQIKELIAVYRGAVGPYGVSENEFWIWYALIVIGGEYSQQDICDLWSLPKQTVNSVVKNFVGKGYASLNVVPGTRNRKVICLTDAGRAYGESVVRPVYEAEQRSLARISEEKRRQCIEMLGEYIGCLKEEVERG